MRLANLSGRLHLVTDGRRAVDIGLATHGALPADPSAAYERWSELLDWARGIDPGDMPTVALAEHPLGNPVPRPRQVFAIGLNYADHAAESRYEVPKDLTVFTKFPACLTGPHGTIVLPDGDVDWEVELVVVVGRQADSISEDRGWDHVAGLTVGQDLSERRLQFTGPAPQFSLAKSFSGFGPLGPVLVTADELPDPDALDIACLVNGATVQKGTTADMIWPVPELLARLSAVTTLLPGDVVFTGTPPGVGFARTPPIFLQSGDELVSSVQGIGEMRHLMAVNAAPTG